MKNKAQASGAQAAVLVFIILVIIVAYIALLPPDDRQDLLDEHSSNTTHRSAVTDNFTVLEENPKRIDYIPKDEYDHLIPSFKIYRTVNSFEIAKQKSIIAKNNWFDKKVGTMPFKIENLDLTGNILLSFVPTTHDGILVIKLNGQPIMEEALTQRVFEPLELPRDYLQAENELEFSVSEAGWQFWKSNEYQLDNIRITGDITDISRQESMNVFTISDVEKNNMEKISLRYNPDCTSSDVGMLDIMVNGYRISSGVPDCATLNKVEFSTDILNEGQNRITFKTTQGSYLIDQIMIKSELKAATYPVYYFDINSTHWKDITNNKADVNLTFRFVDDLEDKTADIYVNGRKIRMDTGELTWTKLLDGYVIQGTNSMKIVPETVLDVVKLKIEILWED
jgi:hypothetical protein